jgi:hypothetical protein
MKANKYMYGWKIWTNWGYGWECEAFYDRNEDTYQDVKRDAHEYRLAGAQVRVTESRMLNQ